MIKVCIKGQKITDFSSPQIVADSIDYITAAFHFLSSDWDGLTKYAHFSNGKENYDIELIDDVISVDKHLNFTAGEWSLWVHGSIIEGGKFKQRIPTDPVTFYVIPTGTTDTGNPFPSAVPSITEQIMAEIGDLDGLETADKQTLVDAINEVFRTAGGEISPELIAAAVQEYLENNPIGEEKDPTVPDWAKQKAKPTYTADEVGALPKDTKIPSLDGYATEQFVKDEIGKIELPEGGGSSGGSDHADLSGRDKADQHPISAITGLEPKLLRPGVNLLHNADWAYSLVNQRGHSGAVTDAYCVDRWIGNGSVTPVTKQYVTLASGTTMTQRMEIIPDALVGKACTFSIDVDGESQSVSIAFPNTATAAANTAATLNCTVELGFLAGEFELCGVTCSSVPYIKVTTAADINIKRVFLEFGNVSHMAETQSEDYNDNLLICQRYETDLSTGGGIIVGMGMSVTSKMARILCSLPTSMRTKPSLEIQDISGLILRISGVNPKPSAVSVFGNSSNTYITFNVTVSEDITSNQPCALINDSGIRIMLSSRL